MMKEQTDSSMSLCGDHGKFENLEIWKFGNLNKDTKSNNFY